MKVIVRVAPFAAMLAAIGVLACWASTVEAARAEARSPHQEALMALSDMDAAIAEMNAVSRVTANDAAPYHDAAKRALNVVVGEGTPDYDSSVGEPGDRAGALDHLSWLSAHAGQSVWGPAVQGALVNIRVAEADLASAAKVDELEQFWSQSSAALQSLLVAAGRPSGLGVLGGMRGALATTDLGVPADAMVVSGCVAPARAPAYGVTKGYLTYVALPRAEGTARLPETIGVREVSVRGEAIVMHTAATDMVGSLCPVREVTAGDPPNSGRSVAALYTEQQAEQGKQVFDSTCAACHGGNLQGTSAPPVGGSAFLQKAQALDWSIADMRNLVVSSMPANNPGSLSQKQYADVLAYLLAANCYPAGNTSFPTNATAALKQVELHPLPGTKGQASKEGTCSVKR